MNQMNQMNLPNESTKPILPFISDRALAILSFALAIVGVVLSVIFYFESKSEPDLTFWLNPSKQPVLKSGVSTKLKVSFEDQPIATDLSSAEFIFWNAGRKPVLGSDILDPIKLITSDGSRILETKVLSVSRPVIKLSTKVDVQNPDSMLIDFGILEQNDGAKIQIIYQGGTSVNLISKGEIVGQKKIIDANLANSFLGKQMVDLSKHGYDFIEISVSLGTMLPAILVALFLAVKMRREQFYPLNSLDSEKNDVRKLRQIQIGFLVFYAAAQAMLLIWTLFWQQFVPNI